MKYFLRILIVIVASFAIICAAYYGINGTLPIKETSPETTITKPAATEKHSNKKLVASLTSENIFLYKTTSGVLLTVKSQQFEFNNWGKYFDAEEPEIYSANFDNDNDKEIVIKAVEFKDSNGKFVKCIYYLDPSVDEAGKLSYSVSYFNSSAISDILDNTLVEDVRQLNTSKKMTQFSINYRTVGIAFDKSTGIATNGYAGYFASLCDSNKNYLTIKGWKKGAGEYSITDDNKIIVDVPVFVNYNETNEAQLAGKIHFRLEKGQNGKVVVGEKSLIFVPNNDYLVSDPTKYEPGTWSYTERNNDIIVDDKDKLIDWIKYKTAYDPTITTQTISYAVTSTDIRSISSLTITEKSIVLTAKPNVKFSDSYKKGEYSVIINEGTKNQFDISYTANVTKAKNGIETLTITFDKAYPKNQIKTLNINYGAK